MLTASDAVASKVAANPTHNPMIVGLPNFQTIQSQAAGTLQCGQQPIPAHIFNDDHLQRSLVSVADYTNHDCVATFTKHNATIVDANGTTVLHANKEPDEKLWKVNLTAEPHQIHHVIRHELHAELVDFWSRTLGCPTHSTLLNAMRKGYLTTIPQLTASMVANNPAHSKASAQGHLDRTRQGQRSTRSKQRQPESITVDQTEDEVIDTTKDTHIVTRTMSYTNHADATGRFPVQSKRGNQYMLVSVYNNYIHVVPMASRKGTEYVKAYTAMFAHFRKLGIQPKAQRLDNETSAALTNYLTNEQNVSIEYVPPDNHRTNKAERAIRDVKNHFIATMSATAKAFPMELWDEAIEQLNITINLLRPYGPDASISAYEGTYKQQYDFNQNPMAPFGTEVLIFDSSSRRASWAPHGTAGFYLGPALDHYRCYRTYAVQTQATRITDTVHWLLAPYRVPGSSSTEILHAAITDVNRAFQSIIDHHLLPPGHVRQATDAQHSLTTALQQVTKLFCPNADDQRVEPIPVQHNTTTEEQRVVTEATQYDHHAAEQRVHTGGIHTVTNAPRANMDTQSDAPQVSDNTTSNDMSTPTEHAQDDTTLRTHLSEHNTVVTRSTDANSSANEQANEQPADALNSVATKTLRAKPTKPTPVNTHRTRSRANANNITTISHEQLDNIIGEHMIQCQANQDETEHTDDTSPESLLSQSGMATQAQRDPEQFFHDAIAYSTQEYTNPQEHLNNATLNLDEQGRKLTYQRAIRGPERENWVQAEGQEISRLLESDTICPIHSSQQPPDRRSDTTYYNPQTKEKINDQMQKTYRIRGTAGGDKINYPGNVSANTADMEVVKLLIQSVASDRHNKGVSNWMTLDIKDYYLGAPLERPEYIRIPTRFIPADIQEKYNLSQYIQRDAILFEISKCMYGLPQAGYLSQQRLIKHLAAHGYRQHPHVPCLFKHDTNSCVFTLVVDDFGLKYSDKKDAQHLIDTLHKLYKLHIDWDGKKYLGFCIEFDDRQHEVTLSMPNYIPRMLEHFFPGTSLAGAPSPAVYTPPTYGAKVQQTFEDTSDVLSAKDKTRLQAIIGSLLFYARAIDCTLLPAVTAIASTIANPTTQAMAAAERTCNYAATYPNNKLVYKACDMVLYIHSDASYFSRPGGRSVIGGLFYCGNRDDTHTINGPIMAISSLLSVVAAAVSEAEYGACFHNGQTGAWLRTVLSALNYEQPTTTIQCDNACAVGLANSTVKAKKSKSIDLRFHWIRDRVQQKQFNVFWREGTTNLADFFTKPLPVHEHQRLIHKFVRVEHDPNNKARTRRMHRHFAYWSGRLHFPKKMKCPRGCVEYP